MYLLIQARTTPDLHRGGHRGFARSAQKISKLFDRHLGNEMSKSMHCTMIPLSDFLAGHLADNHVTRSVIIWKSERKNGKKECAGIWAGAFSVCDNIYTHLP